MASIVVRLGLACGMGLFAVNRLYGTALGARLLDRIADTTWGAVYRVWRTAAANDAEARQDADGLVALIVCTIASLALVWFIALVWRPVRKG